jgi:hypothetical protein
MIERVGSAFLGLFLVAAAASCGGTESDPGPLDIDGWIGQCRDRCDQLHSCSYDQLVYDHGDLDNCKGSCTYRLDYEDNLAFVEETPDGCLAALYSYVGCVFSLGCDELGAWAAGEDGAPCAGEEAETNAACEGVETDPFLDDCGYPTPPAGL